MYALVRKDFTLAGDLDRFFRTGDILWIAEDRYDPEFMSDTLPGVEPSIISALRRQYFDKGLDVIRSYLDEKGAEFKGITRYEGFYADVTLRCSTRLFNEVVRAGLEDICTRWNLRLEFGISFPRSAIRKLDGVLKADFRDLPRKKLHAALPHVKEVK